MSKLLNRIKRDLVVAFHSHKFEPDDLNDLKHQFYLNRWYGNSIFDNSTMRTYANGRYYCQVCCQPNHGVWVEYNLTIGNEKHLDRDINQFLATHKAKVLDYTDPQTLTKITSRRGVIQKITLESLNPTKGIR